MGVVDLFSFYESNYIPLESKEELTIIWIEFRIEKKKVYSAIEKLDENILYNIK